MSNQADNKNTPELVLMMGLPASGKSYVRENMFLGTHSFIDCDTIKESMPEYDPLNPQTVHEESKLLCHQMMLDLFENPTNAVYDSTGTNSQKMTTYIHMAQDAGMTTRLVFVDVSIETSIYRNANRPRVVPEHIIRTKAQQIYESYDIVSSLTDSIEKVLNE